MFAVFLVRKRAVRAEDGFASESGVGGLFGGRNFVGLAIGISFHQLRKAGWLLERQSVDLTQANRELLTSAKTSAVGAVTAHLIHELKNPLSGPHQFVSSCARDGGTSAGAEDWSDAVSATRRMQATIQEIVGLLREGRSGTYYTLPLPETAALVLQRLSSEAAAKGIRLLSEIVGEKLPNRVASLVTLILVNLGSNAIQVSPLNGTVTFGFDGSSGSGEFTVRDSGGGFRKDESDRLFHPRASTHEGGTGIGLAICKQLANHMGALLEFKHNGG